MSRPEPGPADAQGPRTSSESTGHVVVLAWTQWFINDPRVQLLWNGRHVGSVTRGERAEFDIDGDGELTFKFGDRLRQLSISSGRVTTIQLRWDRTWGRLRAGIIGADGHVSWQRARRGDRQIDAWLWIGIAIGLAASVAGLLVLNASFSSDLDSRLLQAGAFALFCVGGGIGLWMLLRMVRRFTSAKTPAPGWYAEPNSTDQVRYWDGYVWTAHTAPHPDPLGGSSGGTRP